MPLYEYGCPVCGTTSDVRHGFNEKPELTCEQCGAALQRHFSAAPIVFKGSGFYATDSRAKREEKSEKPKSDGNAASGAKAETKTESTSGSADSGAKTDNAKKSETAA